MMGEDVAANLALHVPAQLGEYDSTGPDHPASPPARRPPARTAPQHARDVSHLLSRRHRGTLRGPQGRRAGALIHERRHERSARR